MSISTKLQQIAENNQFDIDLANLYYNEDTFNDFCDKVNDAIMQEEVIYYYSSSLLSSRLLSSPLLSEGVQDAPKVSKMPRGSS